MGRRNYLGLSARAMFDSARRARETVSDCSLRSLRFALGSRLVRRRSWTKERVHSLLLTTAARETRRSQTREYLWFQGQLATIGPCRLRLSGCLGEGRRTVID